MIYEVRHPDHGNERARLLVDDGSGTIRSVYMDGRTLAARLAPILGTCIAGLHPRAAIHWEPLRAELLDAGCIILESEPAMATNQKVALWCRLYEQHKGLKYRVTGKDAGMLSKLPLNEDLLAWYLNDKDMPQNATTWLWRGKQSVANLARYWNEVRAAMAAPAASRWPDHYSKEYERKLTGEDITAYRRHLRSIGLTPVVGRDGAIIDFKPAH